MKTVCRKLILAIFVAFLILPMAASYSFATDQGTSSLFVNPANKMSGLSEDFSLDGLSAKASDGGSPLLGDECELGLSVSGNAGSVRYKFVWEQGGWSRWGSIRQGEPSASCPWTPEVAGDVNIWVDAIDSAGRVTTRKFPVHVDACRLSVDGGPDLEWSPGMKVPIHAAAAPGAKLKFVWQKDSWAEWGVAQGPSEATSCAWEPASSGSYKVYVDVSVGGGAIALTLNGDKQVVSLKIAKDAIDPEDPEMLEDLITTAFNEASKKADEMVQKGMSEVTGGLGLPGGMF